MTEHLLLLHGALGAASQFKILSNRLKEHYTVHSFNFIGHGGTTIPDQILMPDLVNQLDEYIQKNISEEDVLRIFGYSMGGYVALMLASKENSRIDRIITLGTKLEWNEEIASKEIKMLNPDVIEQKVPAFAEELKNRHQPEDWKLLMNRTAGMMLDLGNNQYLNEEVFKPIKTPCKLMLGDNDNMVTREETIFAHQLIIDSDLVFLPDTAHPIEKVGVELLIKELVE